MLDRPIFLALGLLLVILVGLQLGFGIRLPGWAPVLIYVVLYSVVAAFMPRSEPESTTVAVHPVTGEPVPVDAWPTSGPIGRFRQKGLVLSFQLTSMLALANPFQFVEIVRQGAGNARIRARIREDPPMPDTWVNRVRYTLPLGSVGAPSGVAAPPGSRDGPEGAGGASGSRSWFVYNGGVERADSHSWEILTQRFAYDFVVVDSELRRHVGRGTRPEDYFCNDLEIVAAADGIVVEVEQDVRTAPLLGRGMVDFTARSFVGNRVVVRHADDEYSLYAHLARGSAPVAVGDSVRRGQCIGRCGHTGHSSEPHLHFHLQDRADFFTAAGLPIRFHHLFVDGKALEAAWIRAGQRVAARGAEAGEGGGHG